MIEVGAFSQKGKEKGSWDEVNYGFASDSDFKRPFVTGGQRLHLLCFFWSMSHMVVKQVADAKFYEYGTRNNGSGTAVCDRKQQPSGRKAALRDSCLNEAGENIPYSPGNPSLQKDGNDVMLFGSKRERPTCSNPQCQDSTFCNCSKENLVYVRRKIMTESFNLNVASDGGCLHVDDKEKFSGTFDHEMQQSGVPQIVLFGSSIPLTSMKGYQSMQPSFPHALGKLNGNLSSEPNRISTYSFTDDSQAVCIQQWKERFVSLQIFLKECDKANRDEYIHMLRSLSASGRSKHAVELEKRTIHLLLEEGKELHRMKALNVLGKPVSGNLRMSDGQSHSIPTASGQ